MIRRRKSEVLRQLPDRTDQNVLIPMTEPQMDLHKENADAVVKIVQRWRKTEFLSDKDQRRLTCALQNMRMSCNSTYLLDQESDHDLKSDELAALLDQSLVAPDAKAAVFSQWTRTHDVVIRASRRAGSAMSASMAGYHPRSGRNWSSAFGTIPLAACSCPRTPAARVSISSTPRCW